MDKHLAEQYFTDGINALYGATLITADPCISRLLATISGIPELFAVIEDCKRDFDYAFELQKALGVGSDDPITLPLGKRQIVALTTGIIFDFDTKNLPIVDFIMRHYPAENHYTSYVRFLNELITPYKNAFLECMTKGTVAVEEAVSDEAVPITRFPDNASEDTGYYLAALKDAVVGNNDLSDDRRKEMMTVINGMEYILETKNPILIKVGYLGLKNSLALYRMGNREIVEIEKILLSFGVL